MARVPVPQPPTASARLAAALDAAQVPTPQTGGAHAGAGVHTHVVAPPPPREPDKAAPTSKRDALSVAAMTTVFAGSVAKSGIDLARVTTKLPESFAARAIPAEDGASRLAKLLHERVGRVPQNIKQMALIAPDTRIIDPRAPGIATLASEGRSFTKFDRGAYTASSVLGAGLAGLQFASSIPNLAEAYGKDGVAGFYDTKSGRSGVLQAAGGALGLGTIGVAMAHESGGLGSRFMGALGSDLLTRPTITNVGIAASLVVVANEMGFFDFLDKGNTRSVGDVMSDAVHKLPFI